MKPRQKSSHLANNKFSIMMMMMNLYFVCYKYHNSTLRYISKRNENRYSNKYLYIHAYSSTVPNNQKRKQLNCPSMDERISKLWYTQYNEIFSHKKKY